MRYLAVDAPEDSPNFVEMVPVRAEVYTPEGRTGWWGGPDTRLRCREDDKVVFVCEDDAKRAVAKAGDAMKYYRGQCGHLHLARKRK